MDTFEKFKVTRVTSNTLVTSLENNLYANVNAAAIALKNYIIIVDTTIFPKHASYFRKKAEQYFNLPVKYLFLTHYHGDHVFGANSFSDVNILGSNQLIKNMKSDLEKAWTPKAF